MKESKVVHPWNDLEKGPFQHSKRNWMAIKTYSEIEPVRVPGEKTKSMDGVHVRDKGERL